MPMTDIKDPGRLAEELEEVERLAEEQDLSPNEIEDLKETVRKNAIDRELALAQLGGELEVKFKRFAGNRTTKEDEWISVLIQYNSRHHSTNFHHEKGQLPSRSHSRRKPTVNITRARTRLAFEKLQDIQFPLGGDYNFHIDALLDPEMERQVNNQDPLDDSVQNFLQRDQQQPGAQQFDPAAQQQGQMLQQTEQGQPTQQPQTVGEQAQQLLSAEKEKARKMELRIKDQLTLTKYGRRARKAMRDWAILGTAIIKGPVLEQGKQKFYEHFEDSEGGLQSELKVEEALTTAVHVVDPRFFYPDDSLDGDEIEELFELHLMTKGQLRELSKTQAFMDKQIRRVLEDIEPDGSSIPTNTSLLFGAEDVGDNLKRYAVKEFHGPIPKDILFDLGEISEKEKDDELVAFYGEAWVVAGHIIRVSLSMLDGDDSHPYHIAVWEVDDSSPFGHGMPYMMADQQRVVEASWQMLVDNAGLSAGPQIVLDKEAIVPANGKWELESMKIWYMSEFGQDVQSAMQFVDIPNNQQSLMNVITSAMQFADIESQSPMIQANTAPEANVPATNMGLVMIEANVHQRELSQHWDDNITIPLINRFIHYNIQYSDDPELKGNFKANVGGATERIDNQILAQDIERLLGMASQNPKYMLQIKEDQAFRMWARATRAGPELLRSAEEVEAEIQRFQQEAAQQPPDAETIRAQAVAAREEARQAELQAEQQIKQAELQFKQQQQQLDAQIKQAELQLRRAEIAAKAREAELNLQIAILEAQQKSEVDQQKIFKDLSIEQGRQDLQRELKAIDLEKFNTEVAIKREQGTGI